MYLLLPKHYIQTLLFVCLIIAPKLLFGQYILDKQVKFEQKKGTKPILKPIEAFYAKGDKLYFMADNSITITDNNGLLVDKIPAVKQVSLGYKNTIGKIPVDADNNFYDFDDWKTIKKYSANRTLLNTFDVSAYADYYARVNYIEIDNDNNLYFSGGSSFITVLSKDGIWLRQIGKAGNKDGEFSEQITKIVVSKSGTIYARSGNGNVSDKIQIFNKDGGFLRKIALQQEISEFCVDNDDNVYIIKAGDNSIYPYDKTGKALTPLAVSTNKNISPKYIVKKSDNKIIAYCKNAETTGYEFYDVDANTKSDIVITASDADYPTRILDAQINPITQNITFLDEYKVVTYDKNFKVVKSAQNFDKGIVTKKHPNLFAFDSKGEAYFLNELDMVTKTYELYAASNPDTPLCKIKADYYINKIIIDKDSLNNPIILATTVYSVSSYSFAGTLIKKNIKPISASIGVLNKNPDGTFSLLSTGPYSLQKYDSNFKLISSQYLDASSFNDFIETSDGYLHTIVESSHTLRLEAFNSKGKNINKTNFDVNYPSGSFIRAFNNQLIIAGPYMDFFSVLNFKYDNTLQPNYVNGPSSINPTTFDKGLDLSTIYSSSAKNITYKLVSGESVKISSGGILEVLKGGESIIEVISPATSIYNGATKKVLVTVNKTTPTVTGVENINKTTVDSDFVLNIKSNATDKPTILLESGSAISFDTKTNTVKILKTGVSKLKVYAPETDLYKAYSYTILVTVSTAPKLTPDLSVDDITKKIDAADFTLVPTTKSDGEIIFSVVEGDAIEVSLQGKVKILKAGVVRVFISQSETDKYLAKGLIITITIEKLDQAIDAGTVPTSLYLNSTGFDINPTSNSGLGVSTKIVSGPAKLEGKRVVLLGNAGVIEMEFSQAGDAKYKAATTLKKSVEVKLVLANLEEPSDASVKVFPNPVATTLQLRSDGKPFGLQIISMLGTVVFEKEITKEETEIDLNGIKPGNYVLIIQKNNKLEYIKIQKQ
ncbi:T9SS type A sorting domain-containing protein [Arcicella aquatica]|uniref:T9SS type A sorting domain-containing protein n=1 Tax=Arcicella aquatica TaxID=217141 RepID=A0ABU5QPY2_9BACT|nr:T9SS type A sorting domain-containing protein [Arcicella aquatica]MEA5259138.1 T9SS type A sorting domain-containing protein [Arcicella aquatica]